MIFMQNIMLMYAKYLSLYRKQWGEMTSVMWSRSKEFREAIVDGKHLFTCIQHLLAIFHLHSSDSTILNPKANSGLKAARYHY